MLRHGEPGFTVNTGAASAEVLRNACTEIVSAHDSDVCNLGSLVLPRFDSVRKFERAVRDAALFLTAGSVYSDVPYEKVAEVREKNRRLGLGLMGVHEFLMRRGVRYGTDDAFGLLDPYMRVYARALEFAIDHQDRLGLSRSIAAQAIAPNGTIGIAVETTPSGDPLFSDAESRTIKRAQPGGDVSVSTVIVDPVAKRLVASGVPTSDIEDAYSIDYDRRLAQQAYLQRYVDQSISSTVNIPHPVTDPLEVKRIGATLMRYLPDLRGVTFYPDGARSGQPRTPVDLDWALSLNGGAEVATDDSCINGVCGV
jgi:ribonucleoside-diphosphate reductase alpha chain